METLLIQWTSTASTHLKIGLIGTNITPHLQMVDTIPFIK